MKDLLKKAEYMSVLSSIFFLILGIFLVNYSEGIIQLVSTFIGILFILIGLFKVASYFIFKNEYVFYNFNLLYGFICAILGLFIIICGSSVVSFFRIIIGIWIVLSGINRIDLSFKIKDSKISYWFLSFIISILILISGIYIIFAPGAILTTLGIVLIIYSIMDIIENIIYIFNINKLFK